MMLPNTPIASQVNVELTRQAIYLLRCHATKAEHANLLAVYLFLGHEMMKYREIINENERNRPAWLCAPMKEENPTFQDFRVEHFSFQ